jgi:hypothetical protein
MWGILWEFPTLARRKSHFGEFFMGFSHSPYYAARMIPFDEIDKRLELLGKTRAWLAEETGRSPDSIRAALAPNSPAKNRTALLQKALTDAIEREELERKTAEMIAKTDPVADRITIQCTPEERRHWQAASGADLDGWIVHTLNDAATKKLRLAPAGNAPATGTNGP